MKKYLLTILFLTSLVLSGCFSKPQSSQNVNQNTAVIPEESGIQEQNTSTPTSTDEIEPLVVQINNWNLYKQISNGDKKVFDFDSCGDVEFDSLVDKVNSGDIYELKLNGELTIIYTPNYYQWTNDQLLLHKSFCQAGAIWPRHIYNDKILWVGVCSSGLKPDKSDPSYLAFQKCLMAEEAVKTFLKQNP